MGEGLDPPGLHQRKERSDIDSGWRNQRFDQQYVGIEQRRAVHLPALVLRQTADQRKAVGMDAGGFQAKQQVAGFDGGTGHRLLAFHRADTETGKVIIAFRIHAWHFGGFAADQCAARRLAAFRNPCDNAFRDTVFQPAGSKIIQEKQRLRALNDQVIDTHGDEIDADRIMPVMVDRQLELGADPVIGGDQQRVPIAGGFEIKKASEAAQFGIGPRSGRGFGQRRNCPDQGIACCNGHTGFRIGVRIRFILLFTHNLCD